MRHPERFYEFNKRMNPDYDEQFSRKQDQANHMSNGNAKSLYMDTGMNSKRSESVGANKSKGKRSNSKRNQLPPLEKGGEGKGVSKEELVKLMEKVRKKALESEGNGKRVLIASPPETQRGGDSGKENGENNTKESREGEGENKEAKAESKEGEGESSKEKKEEVEEQSEKEPKGIQKETKGNEEGKEEKQPNEKESNEPSANNLENSNKEKIDSSNELVDSNKERPDSNKEQVAPVKESENSDQNPEEKSKE